MTDFTGLSPKEFLESLWRGTDGLWPLEAAVRLLEQHGTWLADPRLRTFVTGGRDEDGELWSGLDIQRMGDAMEAGELGDGEDSAVLRFTMSLYGNYTISLRYICDQVSEPNLILVGKAMRQAAGYSDTA
ncbi:hypothetical protein ACIBSR_03925 [Streptomyces sp. NPDC049936]|uniref:hypothetical protein n=1 Tax=Streptomyces sp. NPDC049936 TaxID=3365599 RepID=UPI0037B33927